MDYYDYNVTNASAAPGSYFSLNHLMWVPSLLREDFDEENRIDEDEDEEDEEEHRHLATRLNLAGDEGIDPGSNSESPESEDIQLRCSASAVAKHNNLGCAISILSDEDSDVRSDAEQEKRDNKITEKKQLATAQYYKNYYDQMDDIQFADEEDDAV